MPASNPRAPAKLTGRETDQCLIIVMGVSGTGKSTLGRALAKALGMAYVEGDDLHPRSNIDKMSTGQPLTDADREPWLELVRSNGERMAQSHLEGAERSPSDDADTPVAGMSGAVVTCSALKRSYRDILRGKRKPASEAQTIPEHLEPPDSHVLPTYFVFMRGDRETLMVRMQQREGHFMKANMLDSQLATLEDPEGEEGVVVVDITDPTERQVENAIEGLKRWTERILESK